MNKRIQELALQAGFHPALNWDHTDWHSAGHSPLFEKFAELIVRECAGVELYWLNEQNRKAVAEKIKEHFGVE